MNNQYDHVWYLDWPHFTVGRADQWGENGYLLYENQVFDYYESRKDQYGVVENPRSIVEFLEYANKSNIEIPIYFKEAMNQV